MSKPEYLDWRSLDRAQLDAGLNNSLARENSAALVNGWEDASAQFKAEHSGAMERSYGPRPRNRFDYYKGSDGGPVLILIHGGYWQLRSKEMFSIFAEGPLAHGINVANIGYTLAPDATLGEICAELHAGVDALVEQLPELGGDAERIIVSGWSAGGHLTATTLAHPRVKGALGISGIYDLEPIRHSYLNDKLQLDEAASLRNSPIRQGDINKPLALVVGSAELPLLRQQSADFAAHRASRRLPIAYEEIPGADHYSVLDELRSRDGRITMMLRELIARI